MDGLNVSWWCNFHRSPVLVDGGGGGGGGGGGNHSYLSSVTIG